MTSSLYLGIASFRQGLDQFARMMKSIDVIRVDTVFGPVSVAEHIRVANGEIVSIRGLL